METLKPEQIAYYLPYKVLILWEDNEPSVLETLRVLGTNKDYWMVSYHYVEIGLHKIKLILRPLSDLTKEIEIEGKKFVPLDFIENRCNNNAEFCYLSKILKSNRFKELPYWVVCHLFEWHFDIDNLIGKGLAVDINKLNK